MGKFEFVDFSFNLNKVDNSWAILLGGTILGVQAMSTDQAVLQKYFTTRSSRETSKSLLFYGAVIIPLITLLSVLGVLLFVFYHSHPAIKATLRNTDAIVPHYAATMRRIPFAQSVGIVVRLLDAGRLRCAVHFHAGP